MSAAIIHHSGTFVALSDWESLFEELNEVDPLGVPTPT